MMSSLPPGGLMILGALVVPLLRGRALQAWMLLVPLLSAVHLLSFDLGHMVHLPLFDRVLTPIRIDKLSLVWGYVFHLAAFLAALFSLHVRQRVEHAAGLAYAGAAIAAVFSGDLISLFVFWELTAITSVFLVWATGTRRAYVAGLRYLVVQVLSGVLLLAGTVLRVGAGHDLVFGAIGWTGETGDQLIFLAFAIKAAFPLLHNWLQDAYPNATPTGTVFLSAFTTKLAIYALARGFAGTDILIPIGVVMTIFPVFYAVIENDLRRVLSYSLNNQLGFMVVGVGVGTELALNGTAAHAFAHILYKSLLFMAMGAVLLRTGTTKASELGGLYKSMPWTAAFCIVGAVSISGFPLFSGFVSKSMILSAVGEEHLTLAWLGLMFASAGVMDHSGIKIPYFTFFAHDSGKRPEEAPPHMLLAMGLTALACFVIGVAPGLLYAILPYEVHYVPYTVDHVVSQMQLLLGAAFAFGLLNRIGAYPPERLATVLDTDWVYRRLAPRVLGRLVPIVTLVREAVVGLLVGAASVIVDAARREGASSGSFGRTLPTGRAALSVAIVLTMYALLYFRIAAPLAPVHGGEAATPHGSVQESAPHGGL
jgi:multicomponent Na+:H+ antiporter subunit D